MDSVRLRPATVLSEVLGSEPKRLSVSPDEDTFLACSRLTTELDYKFVLLKVRLVTRHGGRVKPTFIDPVPIELAQKANARKEGHQVYLFCKGPTEIEYNSLHRTVLRILGATPSRDR
jgi:hypothetical protein